MRPVCVVCSLRYNTDVPIIGHPQPQPAQLQKTGSSLRSVPPTLGRINAAIIEVNKNYAIASFKPHLNYHECYLTLVISQKLGLPLKVYGPSYSVFC